MGSDPARDVGDDLLAFFRSLSPSARREYEALAELDRRFGEDVASEQRARGGPRADEGGAS